MDDPVPNSLSLYGSGLIHTATGCRISSDEVQAFPDLLGMTQAKFDAPKVYLPENVSVITDYEIKQLQDVPQSQLQELDNIRSRVMAHRKALHDDSLLHIKRTSSLQETRTNWILPLLTSLYAVTLTFKHRASSL